jgi:hypothetical protein
MDRTKSSRCPNCSSGLMQHYLPGHYSGTVTIDACHKCNMLWFDTGESTQLAPDGVVELFRMISAKGGPQSAQLGERLGCVRCERKLAPTQDKVSTGQFNYFSCTEGHGRLISFSQFLIEKKFVRNLTPQEIRTLAADVKQVKCSGCGAPVNLASETACSYCRAPIAVFDRNAAKQAIDHYLKERGKQLPANPTPAARTPSSLGHSNHSAPDVAMDVLWAMAQFTRFGARRTTGATPSLQFPRQIEDSIPSADEALNSLGKVTPEIFTDSAVGSNSLSEFSDMLNDVSIPTLPSSDVGSDLLDMVGNMFNSGSDALGNVADVATENSSGILDLVGDGIGSLLDGLFDS